MINILSFIQKHKQNHTTKIMNQTVELTYTEFDTIINYIQQYQRISYSCRYIGKLRGLDGNLIRDNNNKPIERLLIMPIHDVTIEEFREKRRFFDTMNRRRKLAEIIVGTPDDTKFIIHCDQQ